MALLGLVAAAIAIHPASARAGGAGLRAPCDLCSGISGLSSPKIRGAQIEITKNHTWTIGATNTLSFWMSLAGSNRFLEIGLIKTEGAAGRIGCRNTGGDVRIFYWGSLGGCRLSGAKVGNGESHTFRLQRCSGTLWCVWVDGARVHRFQGLGTTFHDVVVIGSIDADGSYSASNSFGGTTAWQVTNDGADCGCAQWADVTDGDVQHNAGAPWVLGPVSSTASWPARYG